MANDLLGKLGEAFVLLRADGETLNADLKKRKKELEKELSSWESSFKSVGKGLSTTVTASFLALGAAALGAGAEIDDALDTIRVKTGLTGDAAKGMEQSFKNVFASVPSSAGDVAEALSVIHQKTGLTGAGLETLATQTLNLARITKTDLNTVLETSQDLFANWGVSAQDQAGKLDFLFKAAQAGGIKVDQLMGSLASSGAVLREFGFDLEQSAALLAQFEKAGIDSETMLGGLKKAAASFAKDGIDLKTGLAATVEELKQLGPGLAAQQKAMDVFGNKVGTQVADAVAKGKLGVAEFYAQLKNSPETITKAADETDGFSEKLKIFKNNVILALEPLGTKLLDIGNKAVPMLITMAGAAGKVADQFKELPEPVQNAAIGLGAVAAAAGPVIYVMGTLLGHVGSMATIFGTWGPSIIAAAKAIATITGGLVALNVAAAAFTGYKLVQLFSLIAEVDGQRAQSSKDNAAQTVADNKAIQVAMEKTGIVAVSAGQAYKILDAYSAGLAGRYMDLSFASNEVKDAFAKGTVAAGTNAKATAEQAAAQEAAGKAAMLEAARQKAAAEAKAAAAEKAKALREELQKLNDQYSGKTVVEDANKLLMVLTNLGGVTKLTKEEAAQMFPVFEGAVAKLAAMGQKVPPEIRKVYDELFKVVKLPELNAKSMDVWTKSWEAGLEKQQAALEKDIAKKNELFVGGLEAASKFITDGSRLAMTEQEKMLADAQKFKDDALKQIKPLETELPDVWKAARDGINAVYGDMVKDANAAGIKSAAAFGKKIGGAVIGAIQQGGGAGAIGGSIGGFLGNELGSKVGEKLGSTVASKLASTLGSKAGAAIGGALGSVVPVVGTILGGLAGKFIGNLFSGGKEKKEVQAAREELIKQAGGIDALKAKAEAAGVSLDKMLSATKMKDFQSEVDKLNKGIEQTQKKVEGINTAIGGVNTLGQGLAMRLGKVYEAAYDAAKKAAKDGNEEITDFTVKGTEEQQAAWQRLAQFTSATFAAQVQQTGDVIGALQSMQPAFDTLLDLQKKFGFEGDESTTKLMTLYGVIKDNADVFTSISGATQIMQGLGEALLVNSDIATTFGQELAADFAELQKRGVDATMALALMQKPLQELWQLQKDGKVTLDETTQAMLDQAEQQGIVGEQMKSVNEKILDVLEAIGIALGATIPESVGKFAKAVGGIKVPPIDVPYRYRREGDSIPGGSDPNQGEAPEFAQGGMANFGMGSLAVLHGPEAVIPLDRLESMMLDRSPALDPAALADALARAGVGGGDITLAPVFNGTLGNEMRSFMREIFIPMTISVLQDSGDLRARFSTVVAPTGA